MKEYIIMGSTTDFNTFLIVALQHTVRIAFVCNQ